jgi:hypothetical protein
MKIIRKSLNLATTAIFSFLRPRVLLLLGFAAMPASASVVLFDNFDAGFPNGYFGVSNTQWTAQAFSTNSEGFILKDVSLRLWNLDRTTGKFEVQIWDALGTSGSPGAQVGPAVYLELAENLGSFGSHLSISDLNVTLVADTTYYLVVAGTELTDIDDGFFTSPGTLAWDATDVNTTASYDTTGSGWNGPFSQNLYMQITAIPEPTSMFLLMLAGGAMLARQKR